MAAALKSLWRGEPDLIPGLFVLLSAGIYLRRLQLYWESPGDLQPEVRRLGRLTLLLPLLFLIIAAFHLATGLLLRFASYSALIWITLPFLAAALFILLTYTLQILRLAPELRLRSPRVLIAAALTLPLLLTEKTGSLEFIIYFLLGAWVLRFEEVAALAGKEKFRLVLISLAALFLLMISAFQPLGIISPSEDIRNLAAQYTARLFSLISPLLLVLLTSLRRLLLALLLVLPGKILFAPVADWLRSSLSIRAKLLLSYVFSSVIPGILLVVILLFGFLFILGSYYQRFLERMIMSQAAGLATVVEAQDPAAADSSDIRRLAEEGVSVAVFRLEGDSATTPADWTGASFPLPLAADSALIQAARQGFSGLAATDDSLYLTCWFQDGSRLVGLFRPYTRADLEELKVQAGADLTVYSGENFNVAMVGARGVSVQMDSDADMDVLLTTADSAVGGFSLTRISLPVLVPGLILGRAPAPESSQYLITVRTSPAAIIGNLLSSEYLVNRVYVVIFAVLSIFFGVILLLVAMVGFGLAGGITRSIRKLRQGTQQLRKGDLSVQIQVRSRDELGELAQSFNLMVADLNRMLLEIKEKERLEGELEAARAIQMKLLPQQAPQLDGYEIAAASLPAKQVGGDYYDFLPLDGARLGLAVGDVSGKGMPAALLMANLQASLHALTDARLESCEMLARLNRVLYSHTAPQMFATFFFAVLQAGDGQLRFVNAGHNYPIICGNGRVVRLSEGGLPLGIFPESRYDEGCVDLQPGEIIALYSDGIVEAVDGQDREFGEERLVKILQDYCGRGAQSTLEAVLREVQAFAGAPQDDVTLMLVKRA